MTSKMHAKLRQTPLQNARTSEGKSSPVKIQKIINRIKISWMGMPIPRVSEQFIINKQMSVKKHFVFYNLCIFDINYQLLDKISKSGW